VVDDVDSLTPEDQQRALELGMRTPAKTRMLLTTRANFSYSPDNVLKLNGLAKEEFGEYVQVVRTRFGLPVIKEAKIAHFARRERRVSAVRRLADEVGATWSFFGSSDHSMEGRTRA